MQPGGGDVASAGTEDQSGITLGKSPLSYISGVGNQFGLGAPGQGIASTISQNEQAPAAAATNPLIAAPAAVAAPVTAAPAAAPVAAAAAAIPQMISRAALYELQKQQQINQYEASKQKQIDALRASGLYSPRQLNFAPTNWGTVTQPANWGKLTDYMNTSMVPNPYPAK